MDPSSNRDGRHRRRSDSGFTLIEVMIVASIIGLLAVISIPNFIRARSRSQMNVCINNLRQIDAAKQQWATEMRKTGGDTPDKADLDAYLGRNGNAGGVLCPAGGAGITFSRSYAITEVSELPKCKIVPQGDNPHAMSTHQGGNSHRPDN